MGLPITPPKKQEVRKCIHSLSIGIAHRSSLCTTRNFLKKLKRLLQSKHWTFLGGETLRNFLTRRGCFLDCISPGRSTNATPVIYTASARMPNCPSFAQQIAAEILTPVGPGRRNSSKRRSSPIASIGPRFTPRRSGTCFFRTLE